MAIVSRGFSGRRHGGTDLPPGQYLTEDFPVLSAGPTPRVPLDRWEFTVTTETGTTRRWDWPAFRQLPSERIVVDLHCVTRWSKLGTTWHGVSLDTLLGPVETSADHALVHCYGGYTTNLRLDDLLDDGALSAIKHDGQPLTPEHGGPLRLVVPRLYLWKSAKWVRGLVFMDRERPGFWETHGYHIRGDPWKEERYS